MAAFDPALLCERMRDAWRHGDRLALAWTAVHGWLRVLMVEHRAFLQICRARPDLWSERRYRSASTLRELAQTLGERARTVEVVLAGRPDAATRARVESLVERFSIRLAANQPVALIDLVGFSKLGPIAQLDRLSGLEKSLCRAEAGLEPAGLGFAPQRTTTGDGFYVWDPAARADRVTRLLALVLTTFVHFDRAGRDDDFGAGDLKATLAVGACFTLHRLAEQTPQDDTFVVGAVTVELERLMSACAPGQILVGSGRRHRHLGTWAAAVEALNTRLGPAKAMLGFRLHAGLTGDREEAGYDRYVVRAKHGYTYPAVNLAARGVDARDRRTIRLGLPVPAATAAA